MTCTIFTDVVEKCGKVNYDVRYKVCDRCGSNLFVRPKKETWKCCAGEKPYNPQKSTCCEGLLSDLSGALRDAKEARCCGVKGYFPDLQTCCLGKELSHRYFSIGLDNELRIPTPESLRIHRVHVGKCFLIPDSSVFRPKFSPWFPKRWEFVPLIPQTLSNFLRFPKPLI